MPAAPLSHHHTAPGARLHLADVAAVIANPFCMMPIYGGRDHCRSEHDERRLDRGAQLPQLRVWS